MQRGLSDFRAIQRCWLSPQHHCRGELSKSEESKWCNYDKFNVFFILEDVTEPTAITWDIGVVVIQGVVQLEERPFCPAFLQGIENVKVPC
ncbi:Uncharacterised protein [Yersinia pseudotuberculosis]|nr:Uncharacterised protein [Yersinia pseudotuberculosis]CNC01884.1 Uncharacterised protein [Yersinia pseudotuberculosis]CNC30195.1 Uncharacterised protein [Yersinia pseudotuberculosis]CRY62008.1 Uncharacterised protein [Yersinia pseudotuberculosis]